MPLSHSQYSIRMRLHSVVYFLALTALICSGVAAAPAERSAVTAEPADMREDLAGNVRRNAMAAYEEEDYEAALPLLIEAYALNPADIEAAGRLGYAAKESGAYEKALDALEAAVAAQPDEYYYWWWLSDTQRLLGKYDAALKSMERARDLAPAETRHELQEYVAYTSILADNTPSWENFVQHLDFADRHRNLRRVRRQIEEYIRALEVVPDYEAGEVESLGRLAWVYQQIGVQYNYIEEPDVAVDYFLVALEYAREAGSLEDVMRNEQFLAIAHRLQADRDVVVRRQLLERTADHWRNARDTAEEVEDIPYLRYTQGRLLDTLARTRPLDDAELIAVRAANLKEVPWQGPINEFSTADAAIGEATVRLHEGDYAGARILYEMALPYYEESQYLSDYHRLRDLYLALARVYYQQGHYQESLRQADLASEKAADARQYVDTDAFNRSAGDHALRHIAAARARACVALDLGKNAFVEIENYKHQQLLNLMGGSIVDDAARTDAISEQTVTQNRLKMLEGRLARAREANDTDEAERILERIEKDTARLAWLERGVAFIAPQKLAFKPAPVASVDALQRALGDDVAFISYLFDLWGGVAVVITKDTLFAALPTPSDGDMQSAAATVAEAFIQTDDVSAPKSVLRHLYRELIAPLASHLDAATLIISADTASDGLFFHAFLDDDAWLADTVAVVYADTASQLVALLEQDATAPKRARMALGREDVHAQRCDAAATFNAVCLRDDDVTIGAVISDIQPDELLHLACNIDVTAANPMLAALEIKAGGQKDVLPTAALLGMKMPAALATLDWRAQPDAATIPGDITRVMMETWRHAGTRALLTTAPALSEASRQTFFSLFYEHLAKGDTKIQAAATAQRAMRSEHPDSLEWVGFQLRGDYR